MFKRIQKVMSRLRTEKTENPNFLTKYSSLLSNMASNESCRFRPPEIKGGEKKKRKNTSCR